MTAWKFLVPADRWYDDPTDSTSQYKGCLIVVVAASREQALARAREWMAAQGHDVGWLRAARVLEIPIVDGGVLGYAEV